MATFGIVQIPYGMKLGIKQPLKLIIGIIFFIKSAVI